MPTKTTIKNFLSAIGFVRASETPDSWRKEYPKYRDYEITVHLEKDSPKDWKIYYGTKIRVGRGTTSNFAQSETLVVLECVNRLLEKGYPPECIELEKDFRLGHKEKGALDIFVSDEEQKAFLMIECKTFGIEHEKEKKKMLDDGGQLFSYFRQEPSTRFLCLYSSRILLDRSVQYSSDIIKATPDFQGKNQKELLDVWDKSFSNNGIFENDVLPYKVEFKVLRRKDLEPLTNENSSKLFYNFLEILRHNVVSDKPNAFNKIFNLFLCKIVDEDTKSNDDVLGFQWTQGERNEEVLMRLNDLYKQGMKQYLDKEITDYGKEQIEQELIDAGEVGRNEIKRMFTELRLYKNQEFAFKEVFNKESFDENCIAVREVVQLLQRYQIKYTKKQQFLGDFFEHLLKESIKQEAGQFFTPIPITRFICLSIPFREIMEAKIKAKDPKFLPYVIDYASGSGHFLTEAMERINVVLESIYENDKRLTVPMREKIRAYKDSFNNWASEFIYGIEKDYRLAKTTKVSCFLNGDGEAQVFIADGLDNFYSSRAYKNKLKSDDENAVDNQQFDMLISNPPYSVKAFKRTLHHADKSFALYNRLTEQSSEIECLFLERAKHLLRDGGYAGMLLPFSILNNPGIYEDARGLLLKHFEIKAIVQLGSGTFMATGTPTLIVFLTRRPNGDSSRLESGIEKFFNSLKESSISGIKQPISKYVETVWQSVSFDDYITLLTKNPCDAVTSHDFYRAYKQWFDGLTEIQNLKQRNGFQDKPVAEQEKELIDRFYTKALALEKEKILYFLLTYGQQVIIVNSGEKDDEKAFLGYEYSARRGHEGIKVTRDQDGHIVCKMYSETNLTDATKVNSYILKNFLRQPIPDISEELQNHVSVKDLTALLKFDRVEFDKAIALSATELGDKDLVTGKWDMVKVGDYVSFEYGTGLPKNKRVKGQYPVVGSNGIVGLHNSYLVESPAIIVGRKGSGGKVTLIDKPCFPIDTTFFLRFNAKEFHYKYLYYILKQLQLEKISGGLGPGGLNRHDAYALKIPKPPIDIQKKIANAIGKLGSYNLADALAIIKKFL